MKKLISFATLALSGLIATSAMAAPDHRFDDRRGNPPPPPSHVQPHDSHWDNKHPQQWNNNNQWNQQRVNPSREWRSGQTLPRAFQSTRYKVSDREARKLPNTGRYQQWYKVNGDYVLINERNDRIIRIIG